MQNGDEASPSIILAGQALLVKMLITLEPHGIFASNFVYLCIFTLSSHCHAKRWRGFVGHHFGLSSSFSENAHNSSTLWYIHFKFCILMYFNIVRPLPFKTVTRLCRASFWPVKLIIIYQLRIVHITVKWLSMLPCLFVMLFSDVNSFAESWFLNTRVGWHKLGAYFRFGLPSVCQPQRAEFCLIKK